MGCYPSANPSTHWNWYVVTLATFMFDERKTAVDDIYVPRTAQEVEATFSNRLSTIGIFTIEPRACIIFPAVVVVRRAKMPLRQP